MKIAPYYQSLLEENLQAVKSMEPITFCGMYDCGIDYLFSLSLPLLQAEYGNTHHLLVIDLSGLDTSVSIETELSYILSQYDSNIGSNLGYFDITKKFKQLASNKPMHLTVYGGQEDVLDKQFLLFLNRLRNLLGWQFSYTLLINAKNILQTSERSLLSDKVVFRNLIWVSPLDQGNSIVVINNYTQRYGFTPTKFELNKIIELSGGNPGLIKSLYLIAKDGQLAESNLLDHRLIFRLRGITTDLGGMYTTIPTDHIYSETGYVICDKSKRRWFTSLLAKYIQNSPQHLQITGRNINQTLLSMTISQRKLLEYLEKNVGNIISREVIAKVIWGDNWEEKYSDWAIDQLISNLRKQMQTIKYKCKLITKRGEGIVLINE